MADDVAKVSEGRMLPPAERLVAARQMMQALPKLAGAERKRIEAALFGPYWPEYQQLLQRGEVQQNAPAFQYVRDRRPPPAASAG